MPRSLAGALHQHFELGAGRRVAIMCRNHRGFVHATAAASRLGCDLVPLNTDFAGPQLADVLAREGVTAAVYDEEFEPVFEAAEFEGTRVVAWHESAELKRADARRPDLRGQRHRAAAALAGPDDHAHLGHDGNAQGCDPHRESERALLPLAISGFLELSRFKPTPRSGGPLVVCPPLFHLYGQIGLFAGLGLGSPVVIRRRFDAEATLEQIERTARRGADGGADDAQADHRSLGGDPRALRHLLAADDRLGRGAAAARARYRGDG